MFSTHYLRTHRYPGKIDYMDDAYNEPSSGRMLLAATVRGRVQNVGFRVFVYEAARMLSLRGYVRNRGDGTVEVLAGGEPARLEMLLEKIRRGPVAARVDSVETEWSHSEPAGLPSAFEVRA